MERSFARCSFAAIHIGTALDEKLTKTPVAMKGRSVQANVFAED